MTTFLIVRWFVRKFGIVPIMVGVGGVTIYFLVACYSVGICT